MILKRKMKDVDFLWASPQGSLVVRNKPMFLRQIPLL
jgi:hypothetical protein